MSEINIPERHDYTPISPFKLFVKSNFPFIEATFESLDNYGLYCKVVEYLNQVIAQNNNMSADVVAFTDFVTNYFQNLDVQEEINNKLDEMAETGVLQDVLHVYFSDLEHGLDTFRSEVDSDLDTMENMITSVVSGAPAGVYATVAALTSADPAHNRIYLVTADGKWYYYTNNTWTAGGVYQGSGIADNSITRAKLKFAKFAKIISNEINVDITTSNNVSTLSVSSSTPNVIEYEDSFVISKASSHSHEIGSDVLYITSVKVDSSYVLKIYNHTELVALTNKNECYILASYYELFLNPLLNEDRIKTTSTVKFLRQEPPMFNILQGSINVKTNNLTNAKILIELSNNRFFALCTNFWNKGKILLQLTEAVELNIDLTGDAVTLCFDLVSESFITKTMSQLRGYKNYVPILTMYGANLFPINNEKSIKLNDIPFYSTQVTVNGAITQTINDCTKEICDPTSTTKIVLVGDSITHGQGGTGFAQNGETIITVGQTTYKRNPDGYCWANLFKDYIEDNFNATVTNNGCTGTSTHFLATNLSTLIPSDTDIAIISYGTNNRALAETDNYSTVYSGMVSDFNSIITYCENNNIKYIINSPVPASVANEESTSGNTQRYVHLFQINNIISSIAATHGTEYNNMYNEVYYYCKDKGLDWEDYLGDGLHPNDNGYNIIYYRMLKGLNLAPSYIEVE